MFKNELFNLSRYIIIGSWNTLFGLGIYAFLYKILHNQINYLIIMIPAQILAITNAYLNYKFFVFKTKGNYLKEYLRCYIVYGGTIVFGFILMYILVSIIGLHPVIAQLPCVAGTIVFSYIGHRKFSFRKEAEKGSI